MTRSITFAALVAVSLVLGSCANLQPLTSAMKEQYGWSEEQLKHIQYYLSDDITLQRKVKANGTPEIAAGKVVTVNGEKVEEVHFKKNTPGVLINNPSDNQLGVAFEDGDNRYLMFVPNPDRGGKFVMAAADWKNDVGKINYDERTFYCTPESGKACLLIDLKKVLKVDRQLRTAPGRKITKGSVTPETTVTPAPAK